LRLSIKVDKQEKKVESVLLSVLMAGGEIRSLIEDRGLEGVDGVEVKSFRPLKDAWPAGQSLLGGLPLTYARGSIVEVITAVIGERRGSVVMMVVVVVEWSMTVAVTAAKSESASSSSMPTTMTGTVHRESTVPVPISISICMRLEVRRSIARFEHRIVKFESWSSC
jgi:hypothetical protein